MPSADAKNEPGPFARMERLARLALPLVLGNIGWMAMQVVDTIMLGRYGEEPRARRIARAIVADPCTMRTP